MIKISHLSFSYQEKEIFHDLNAVFPDSGFVILLGRSGSGKTTLLSLLSHQLTPTSGSIEGIEEKPVMVFQSSLLIDYLTVEENVSLPLSLIGREGKEEAGKALCKRKRENRKDRYPLSLSGGEARRVSLARALVNDQKVLILDEPTGQLDEPNSLLVYKIIKELSKERLVIMVTHDEKNAEKFADILYELEKGQLKLLKGTKEIKKVTIRKRAEKEVGALPLRKSISWNLSFLKRRKRRVFLSAFFLAFNFTLRYLGLTRREKLPERTRSRAKEYYSSEVAEISEKEVIAKSGHRTLKRFSIPSRNTLKKIGIDSSYPSLDYFLPPSAQVRIGTETKDVLFTPVREEKKEKLKEGRTRKNYLEVVVNDSFLSECQRSFSEIRKKKIPLHHQALIYSSQFSASDRLSLDFSFRAVGVSKEKKAFNQPRIYYSYEERYQYLSSLELKNISLERKKETFLKDLLEDINYQEDDFLSRKVLYKTESPKKDKERIDKLYPDSLQITSPCRTREENRDNIASSLTLILGVFLGLSLVSSVRLLLRIVYSLDEDNLRRFALISVFPGKKGNKRTAVFGMVLSFTLFTGLLFLYFSFLIGWIGNLILNHYSFSSLFSFHPLYLFLILLLRFISTIIGCFLPLHRIKEGELKSELEGED